MVLSLPLVDVLLFNNTRFKLTVTICYFIILNYVLLPSVGPLETDCLCLAKDQRYPFSTGSSGQPE